jgi:hypothetical protein
MKSCFVTYDVEPSFQEDERLHVTIAWVEGRNRFLLDVQRGNTQKRRRLYDENAELGAILRDAVDLRLPPTADGLEGLDGTVFKLTIGLMPSTAFTWWMEIPEEWAKLRPIVERIEEIAKREW